MDLLKNGILFGENGDMDFLRGTIQMNGVNVSTNLRPFTTVTKTAAFTATTEEFVNSRLFSITSGGAMNFTTPTAVDIIAAIRDSGTGASFDLIVAELGGNAVTLVGGTDVTVVGTAAVTSKVAVFKVVVTSATEVTIYGVVSA